MAGDSTRNRILIAAGKVFAAAGFKAATVRDICDLAEVNVASVNYYFGDKLGLYNEAVFAARQMRVREVPDPVWNENTPPEQKLYDFVHLILSRLVAMKKSEPWQVRLLMREILSPSDACRQLVQEYFRPFFQTMLTIVDELTDQPLPEPKRLQVGFSILGQCLHYRFSAEVTSMMVDEKLEDQFDIETLARHITSFSLAAVQSLNDPDVDRNDSPTTARRNTQSNS